MGGRAVEWPCSANLIFDPLFISIRRLMQNVCGVYCMATWDRFALECGIEPLTPRPRRSPLYAMSSTRRVLAS
eukprot:11582054-Heterocapsa_arctica.AAC.1